MNLIIAVIVGIYLCSGCVMCYRVWKNHSFFRHTRWTWRKDWHLILHDSVDFAILSIITIFFIPIMVPVEFIYARLPRRMVGAIAEIMVASFCLVFLYVTSRITGNDKWMYLLELWIPFAYMFVGTSIVRTLGTPERIRVRVVSFFVYVAGLVAVYQLVYGFAEFVKRPIVSIIVTFLAVSFLALGNFYDFFRKKYGWRKR
jgi:hypothetical protein